MKRAILVTTAALGIVGLTATQSFAATTSGTGWRLGNGITHLDSSYWSVQFYDQYSIDNASWYVKKTTAELTAQTGIEYKVWTSFTHANDSTCPGTTSGGGHRLIIRLDPNSDRSSGSMCRGANGQADSSHVTLAGKNWGVKTRNGCYGCYKKNVTSHELGHSMGLGHMDWNGTEHVEGACDLPSYNPLMCGQKWGGYWWWDYAHKYTDYDIKGLKALVANRP